MLCLDRHSLRRVLSNPGRKANRDDEPNNITPSPLDNKTHAASGSRKLLRCPHEICAIPAIAHGLVWDHHPDRLMFHQHAAFGMRLRMLAIDGANAIDNRPEFLLSRSSWLMPAVPSQ